MITINFQTRCRDAEHCQNLEKIKKRLEAGEFGSDEIRAMFKQELAGCCGSCEKNENQSLTQKLFKV